MSLADRSFDSDGNCVCVCGTDYHVISVLLGKLVENKFEAVGLQLNAQTTKVPTTQARPPSQLQTPNGLTISVLDRESSHKWLGCMLTTSTVQITTCDVECRLQAAAKVFVFFFPSHLFGRMKVHWYKAVLLGSFQAQTVFILASLQMCWK